MEVLLKLKNKEGMHARPAGVLAKKASEFQSTIQISVNGVTKSAKSIMGIMSLGLKHDQEFKLIIDGPDAETAHQAITSLVDQEFKTA